MACTLCTREHFSPTSLQGHAAGGERGKQVFMKGEEMMRQYLFAEKYAGFQE